MRHLECTKAGASHHRCYRAPSETESSYWERRVVRFAMTEFFWTVAWKIIAMKCSRSNHTWASPVQQQSSSSLSNRFIEHGVRFDPETRAFFGCTPKLSKQTHLYLYVTMSRCCYASRENCFEKNAKLFLEISSCLCGFAVRLCWNRVYCSHVHVLAEVYPSFRVETSCSIKRLLEDEELCCWMKSQRECLWKPHRFI